MNQFENKIVMAKVGGGTSFAVKKLCLYHFLHSTKESIFIGENHPNSINLLDKPLLSAEELASELVAALKVINPHEPYFYDKIQVFLSHLINLLRLRDNYFTFDDIHLLTLDIDVLFLTIKKIESLKKQLSSKDKEVLDSAHSYFSKEFKMLSKNIQAVMQSEISRLVSDFVIHPELRQIFCPLKDDENLINFDEAILNNKIILLEKGHSLNGRVYDVARNLLGNYYELTVTLNRK